MLFSFVGAFVVRENPIDVIIRAVAGVVGVILRLAKCTVAPIFIGMAFGTTFEGKLRQGMISAQGDFAEFISDPIALGVLGLAVAFTAAPIIGSRISGNRGMSESRPNVLLIVTDRWPAALLGAGHPAIHAPVLDQLCRNGVGFSNCCSETPVCLPAGRTLATGRTPRQHGDRTFQPCRPMEPHLPTLAQCFPDAGYQAYAAGKTHTYPRRDRIGFDDVQLDDEGRRLCGVTDECEIFLGDQGHVGQRFGHGMSNNARQATAWHLPERLHATNRATNRATDTMARYVRRRDPNRPSFWYLGHRHPHPPLVPPQRFLDHCDDIEIDMPFAAIGRRPNCPATCKACGRATSIPSAKCGGRGVPSARHAPRSTSRSAR